jgi:dihydroorotate dehydrogenase electron transfer subunit
MLPIPARIVRVEKENRTMKTFTLLPSEKIPVPKPGQFYMVWIPGVGEKPYSASCIRPLKMTVASVGKFSEAMNKMGKGQLVWLRGPYGNGFGIRGKNILLVGGGCGFAPLRALSDEAKRKGIKVTILMGAKCKSELLKPAKCKTLITTDDGSKGVKGFATDALELLLKKERFDCIYSCGPEKMMLRVMKLALEKKIPSQFSLERFMSCGTGLCGKCAINGLLVCKDGPVFTGEELSRIGEFGIYKRDKTGRKVGI